MSYSSPYYSRQYGYSKPPTSTGSDRPSTLTLPTKPIRLANQSAPIAPLTNQSTGTSTTQNPIGSNPPNQSSSQNLNSATISGVRGSYGNNLSYYTYGAPSSKSNEKIKNEPVVTVPPSKSSGNVPYYTTQMTNYRPPTTTSSTNYGSTSYINPSSSNLNNSTNYSNNEGNKSANLSKSSYSILIDSIPNVFCLSCPPAEFKFSDAYRAKTLPRTGKENERLIGFATLPEQVHRKSVKKGFDFTLMTVGESGLGKSTLINSLFLADFYQNRKIPSVNDQIKRTTSIQKHQIEIEERGVKLRLTIIDTPGFGDGINCENSWSACTDFIDDQFEQYFEAESGLNRRHIQDARVHCCLYFISPYGRGLRALDIQALKSLQTRVNIIPVIGKSDTLTLSEVKKLKEQILEDLRRNQVQIYQFPECDEEEDEEFKRQDKELKESIPFAVASSDTFVEVGGRKIRGRQYPWGIVEVENPSHSDFSKLRTMLIQSHMHDLKETTQELHYENFRAKAIAHISTSSNHSSENNTKNLTPPSSSDLLLQKELEIKRMQQMISKMEAKLRAAGKNPSRDHNNGSVIDL